MVYDQTSAKTRLENLRNAIRQGQSFGVITDSYDRIAKYSREDAEEYLVSHTRMISIMPHGSCARHWSLKPCDHFMSCFADRYDGKGPCQYFQTDLSSVGELRELTRIRQEMRSLLEALPDKSPQFVYCQQVSSNIDLLLQGGSESNEAASGR
jgi:hypothetical protein